MKDMKIVQSKLISLITNQLLSLMSFLSIRKEIILIIGGYSRMLIELQCCNELVMEG